MTADSLRRAACASLFRSRRSGVVLLWFHAHHSESRQRSQGAAHVQCTSSGDAQDVGVWSVDGAKGGLPCAL